MLNRWSCIKGRNKKSLFYGKDSQKIQFCVAPLFHDNMMLGGYHLNADADADAVALVVFTRSYTRRCKPSCPGQSCHPSLHLDHHLVATRSLESNGEGFRLGRDIVSSPCWTKGAKAHLYRRHLLSSSSSAL